MVGSQSAVEKAMQARIQGSWRSRQAGPSARCQRTERLVSRAAAGSTKGGSLYEQGSGPGRVAEMDWPARARADTSTRMGRRF